MRAPNYSEDKDFFIAYAYASVSVDPIKGVGQKEDTFWTRIYEKLHLLSAKHFSNEGIVHPMRNRDSIDQRWKKKISKCVQLWNKVYRRVNMVVKSGWNEEMYMEEAGKLYFVVVSSHCRDQIKTVEWLLNSS